MMKYLFAAALLVQVFPAMAQSSFEDFMSEDEANAPQNAQMSEDLQRFSEVLNGTDPAQAKRALEFMLRNEQDEIFQAALDFGLYSSSADYRNLALRALFQKRQQHRFVLDTSNAELSPIGRMVDFYAGAFSADKSSATVTITTGEFNEQSDCWTFVGRENCAIILTGDAISLRDWQYVSGNLQLNDDGVMKGALQYRGGQPVPVRLEIDYK